MVSLTDILAPSQFFWVFFTLIFAGTDVPQDNINLEVGFSEQHDQVVGRRTNRWSVEKTVP